MAKPRTFPITFKAGSTPIKIYLSPLNSKASKKRYDSYVVSYYHGEIRKRSRFNNLTDAQQEADRVRTLILNQDLSALQVTGEDRLIYGRALEVVKELKISLDVMAKEYVAARKVLGDISLLEAVRFYEKHGKTMVKQMVIPKIVEELLTGLKADKRSEYHIRDMEQRLKSFADAFPGEILAVTTKQILFWLRNLSWVDSKEIARPMAAKSRNHYRNAVIQLLNFAREQGYLPKGLPTEAEGIKALDVVTAENEILTVEEMEALLTHAPSYLIPPMAIKAFAGIRTEEMVWLEWKSVNFATKHITIPAEIAKTKHRRIIPISENLMSWLLPYQASTGRISSRWQNPQTLTQAFDRHGKGLGIHVGDNKFRNSFISYRVAVTHDVPRVSGESGNSPEVIKREYLELATEADGKRWFSIRRPDTNDLKEITGSCGLKNSPP